MAVAEGVKVHNHGRVNHAPTAAVEGDVFSFRGGQTGCVMIMEPMTPFLNYYEYKVLAGGAESSIGIGVAERSYPLNRMPGWNRNSIGYHGDDGKLYHENGAGSRFGPTCTDGDRMGCGVDFDSNVGYGYCEVFFTKNGELVGDPVKMKRPLYGLYPIIGLHSRGEKVHYLGHWHRQRQNLLEPMVQDHSPSNMWLRSNNVKFSDDGLTLEYCGIGGGVQDVALAQGKYPLDRTNYYFEIQILDRGSIGAIAVGVGKSSYPLHRHPGWNVGAVGYHADDGKLFVEQGKGEQFGPTCLAGDRIGCGITFGDSGEEEKQKGKNKKEDDESDDGSDSIYSFDDEDSLSDYEPDVLDQEAMIYQQLMDRERLLALGRGGGRFNQRLFPGNDGRLFGRPYARGFVNRPRLVAPRDVTRGESIKSNSGNKCTVYFTRNSERIGDTEVYLPKGGFFPLVGMLSIGEKVRVDLQPLTG